MAGLQHLPIRRKLTVIIVSICGSVLLLAAMALALFQYIDFRRALRRDTAVLADIIGSNVRASLAFQDEKSAQEILRGLRSEPHIVAACLYDQSGAPFATYVESDGKPGRVRPLGADGARFEDGRLVVFRPVILDAKRIGTIYLEAELSGIYGRLRIFVGIGVLVLAVATLIALLLSSWLQRPISAPILELTETARAVAERRDYSVRAKTGAGGEIGLLTDAINAMLTMIEERARALLAANESLQAEVAERQAAENRVNAQVARLGQLNQITRAIGERQDVTSIFQAVLSSLETQMPVDFCCVCLYDAGERALSIASVGQRSSPLAAEMGMSEHANVAIDNNGLSRCVQGELVYEPDVTAVAMPFPQRLAAGGLRSLVVAPLVVESQVFGVLVAARKTPHQFTSGDCEFLRQLSEHVALAAHQAQLYNALQTAYNDLRQSQQAAMQQERLRALGQMASGIAHDINNAIAPISLYVGSLLEKEPNLSAQSREWLQTVERAIDDVAQTVARMREFYRQREPQLALSTISLNSVAEQVANLTRARWWDMPQQRGVMIDLRRDLAPDLPPIMGVESEIREALTNLIFNAVDAMPSGGTLTIRTRVIAKEASGDAPAKRHVCLEVIDTGIGMDEETQRRCLEPFFTTKGERGTGLGLAMVYGSVRRLGAELQIESALGRGTTMRLCFPPAEGVAPDWAKSDTPHRPASRLRLLIVDDDPILLKSLREILESDGHLVTAANGGQQGIDAFKASLRDPEPFDVVITDLGMPYVDGRKVVSAVKAASAATPVILLTGWGQRMMNEGEVPPDVDRVLSKPPKLRELREALAAVTTHDGSNEFG
jgi:signal transduction histidine kinase/ActR/RegA family two-component response regulator